jgi:hypothetical protein
MDYTDRSKIQHLDYPYRIRLDCDGAGPIDPRWAAQNFPGAPTEVKAGGDSQSRAGDNVNELPRG